MKKIDMIVLGLLIAGGINWGLWGLFEFNLVDYIVGTFWIDSVIYFLIGAAAIYALIMWKSFFAKKAKKGK